MSGRTLRVVQTLLIVTLLLAQEHSPRKSLHAAALACERLLVTGDGACQMRDYKARDFAAAKMPCPEDIGAVVLRGTFRGNSSVLRRRERYSYGLLINNSRRSTAV